MGVEIIAKVLLGGAGAVLLLLLAAFFVWTVKCLWEGE